MLITKINTKNFPRNWNFGHLQKVFILCIYYNSTETYFVLLKIGQVFYVFYLVCLCVCIYLFLLEYRYNYVSQASLELMIPLL